MQKNFIKSVILTTAMVMTISMNVHAEVKIIDNSNTPQVRTTNRFAGADRYGTAVAISREFAKNDTITNCIIANSQNYADSISAAPLSAYLNAPILLTDVNKLNEQTKARLVEMRIKSVYILGGTGVVSADVEAELTAMGFDVHRYGGNTRVETSMAIMKAIPIDVWGPCPKVVNGYDWVQGFSVAEDTIFIGSDNKKYINPIIAVSPKAKNPEDIQYIIDMLKPSKDSWEKKTKGFYKAKIDTNLFNTMSASLPEPYNTTDILEMKPSEFAKYDEMMTAKLGDLHDSNYLPSAYNAKTTKANILINCACGKTAGSDTVLLTSGVGYADTLAVAGLSAKLKAPIVIADKTATEIFENNLDLNSKVRLFTAEYSHNNNVYYIGGTGVLPEGRAAILDGE